MDRPDARHAQPLGAGTQSFARALGADDAHGLQRAVSTDGWSPLWTGLARVGGVLPPPRGADTDPWALLGGRGNAPWRGGADGGAVGPARRLSSAQRPRFDVRVDAQGYAWWYIDAFSDDGRHGLTIIAFIGSVFSPYYKFSGRHSPDNHCAINIAMTGPRAGAWAMTERGRRHVDRGPDHFAVGPSALHWDGACLTINVDEISAPIPARVRGQVRVWPLMTGDTAFTLDPNGRHRWHPVAPRARIEVAMSHPGVSWKGDGYFDSNFGDEPLEAGFIDWHWSRAHLRNDVAVLYEGTRADGERFNLALCMDRQGEWRDAAPPPMARLPRSGWQVDRRTRADAGTTPRVLKTWIDAPFYARSAIATRLYDEDVHAVHESLSLRRFSSFVVQTMLPYRMPRVFW